MTACPEQPWTHLSVDFCGPLSSGELLLVVIDDHSRYPVVEIVHSTSARATIPILDKIFAAHGIPTVLRSDNGPPFNGMEFGQFAKYLGFRHRKITPLWPEANGEVERFMATLEKAVRTAIVERKSWRQEMWKFLRQYRATPHSSTKISPAEALFGRQLNTELPNMFESKNEQVKETVQKNDKIAKDKMKCYADQRRKTKISDIQVGDTVLVRNAQPRKLESPYFPNLLRVITRKGDLVTATDGNKTVTRNISKFKKLPEDVIFAPELENDNEVEDFLNESEDIVDLEVPADIQPQVGPENVSVTNNSENGRYPRRARKPPRYLQDYVRYLNSYF